MVSWINGPRQVCSYSRATASGDRTTGFVGCCADAFFFAAIFRGGEDTLPLGFELLVLLDRNRQEARDQRLNDFAVPERQISRNVRTDKIR